MILDSINNADNERPDFLWRLHSKLRAADIEGQLRKTLKDGFDAAIAEEAVIMSRKERKHLFVKTVRKILDEFLANLEAGED